MTRSRIPVPDGSDFPLENLPYGVFDPGDGPRVGVAIGSHVLDLRAAIHLLPGAARDALAAATLNPFLAIGRDVWSETREAITRLLSTDDIERLPDEAIHEMDSVRMLLPFEPGDFVDFYSSIEHATNLGRMFRPDSEPLLPNWRHLPVGYHGRASSVVVSGTPVIRPSGQINPADGPIHSPTRALDIELEVGFITGPGNDLGTPIPIAEAREHIFGLVLVNDWSARDIQRWEYQPLGPFLGKSFATSVSPWVVTLDALAPYMVASPAQDPEPLDYLRTEDDWGVDLELEVLLTAGGMMESASISRTNFSGMYWTMAQQLAHATVNGTNVRPGDLYASGTVSGSEPGSYGSLIELTWGGERPIALSDGSERRFLEDGDTVTLRGWCERPGLPRIGFGECVGTVVPADASPQARRGTLQPMPLNFDLGGKVYDPVTLTITAEEIEEYARASGDTNALYAKGPGQIASPIFPVVPGFPQMGRVTTDPELNVENPLMILHGEEEIVHHRPIRAGDTLMFTPSLMSVEDKGRNGAYVVRVGAATEDGEPVNEQFATIIVRGAGSGEERPSSPREEPEHPGGPAVTFTRHVPVDMPPRYAKASGDHNPIHLDDEVARMVGLPGVINHGLGTLSLITGGLVEQLAGGNPTRVRRVKVRFTDVVFPGSDLETRVWEAGEGHHFETVRPDGKVVMRGVFEATSG